MAEEREVTTVSGLMLMTFVVYVITHMWMIHGYKQEILNAVNGLRYESSTYLRACTDMGHTCKEFNEQHKEKENEVDHH